MLLLALSQLVLFKNERRIIDDTSTAVSLLVRGADTDPDQIKLVIAALIAYVAFWGLARTVAGLPRFIRGL